MTMRDQTRGNCQVCGRLQATNGTLAKHGYTVDYGYFNGVCYGAHEQPLQVDRSVLDQRMDELEKMALADKDKVERWKAGAAHPAALSKMVDKLDANGRVEFDNYRRRIKVPLVRDWDAIEPRERGELFRSLIYNVESQAKQALAHVVDMRKLADEVHGQPLVEVQVRTGVLRHMKNPENRFGYTMCGRSTRPGRRSHGACTVGSWGNVTCDKCLAHKPVEGGAA